jgi:MFS family permease
MRNVVLLGLASLLTDVSSEMVYPLLPLFRTAVLGARPAVLGLIEGTAESVASVLRVFSGSLSDRLGKRRPLTIAGYAASAAGKVVLVVAPNWGVVLAGRVVDRVGKGIRTAPRDALIADSSTAHARGAAFGLHRALDTWGAVLGAALAYVFFARAAEDYARVFLWSLLPATAGVIVLFAVRERRSDVGSSAARPELRWAVLPAQLKRFLAVVVLFALGNSSNTFLILRARDVGFTAHAAILLYVLYNVTFALSSYPAGRLSDRVGRRRLLVGGYACYGLVYLGFALVDHVTEAWPMAALFAWYGLYSGLTDGVERALISDLAPSTLRGTAIGLHATLVGVGLLPASLIAGVLWDVLGPSAPFYLGAVTGLLATLGLSIVLSSGTAPAAREASSPGL